MPASRSPCPDHLPELRLRRRLDGGSTAIIRGQSISAANLPRRPLLELSRPRSRPGWYIEQEATRHRALIFRPSRSARVAAAPSLRAAERLTSRRQAQPRGQLDELLPVHLPGEGRIERHEHAPAAVFVVKKGIAVAANARTSGGRVASAWRHSTHNDPGTISVGPRRASIGAVPWQNAGVPFWPFDCTQGKPAPSRLFTFAALVMLFVAKLRRSAPATPPHRKSCGHTADAARAAKEERAKVTVDIPAG